MMKMLLDAISPELARTRQSTSITRHSEARGDLIDRQDILWSSGSCAVVGLLDHADLQPT